MTDNKKPKRLGQVARELNVGSSTIVNHLASKGIKIDDNPNASISAEHYFLLKKEYESSMLEKMEVAKQNINKKPASNIVIESQKNAKNKEDEEEQTFTIKSASDSNFKQSVKLQDKDSKEPETIRGGHQMKVVGKIDLPGKKSSKPDTGNVFRIVAKCCQKPE